MLVFPVRISAHKFYGKWHYAYNIIKMIASQINTRDSEDTRKKPLKWTIASKLYLCQTKHKYIGTWIKKFHDNQSTKCHIHLLGFLF